MISPATNAKRSPDAGAVMPAQAPEPASHEALVRDAFDDIALLVGSIAAIHSLDDDILWSLTQVRHGSVEFRDFCPRRTGKARVAIVVFQKPM
jgi:hypothetical protein